MRFAVRRLALSAVALALCAAAPAGDPLAEVAAANGHPAAVHFRASLSRMVEGRRTTLTVDQLGERRLTRRCVAEVCAGFWFDGIERSAFGLNTVLLPEPHDALTPERRTLAAIASYAFAEPQFTRTGGSAVREAPQRWRIRAPQGAALIAELDPAGSFVRSVRDEHGELLALYGHVVRAGGATFALERRGLDEETLDAVEAVAGPLDAPEGAPASFSGEPRVRLATEPIPIVPCALGGRTVRCLLDTGATPSAIALPLAEALGVEPRGELEISAFSRFATGFVEAGPLTIGAAHFTHARFAVVPAVAGAHFDVVIGTDLLARLHVMLDRAGNVARIEAPGAPARDAVPLTFEGGVPLIEAVLGDEPARALLDTGDASTISLGYAQYRRGPQWPPAGRALASGVGGASDAFFVTIPSLRIGDEALGPIRAVVSRTQDRVHIGIGVWTHCIVELDLPLARFRCVGPR